MQADLGVKAADEIVVELRKQYLGRTVVNEAVWGIVKDKLKAMSELLHAKLKHLDKQ